MCSTICYRATSRSSSTRRSWRGSLPSIRREWLPCAAHPTMPKRSSRSGRSRTTRRVRHRSPERFPRSRPAPTRWPARKRETGGTMTDVQTQPDATPVTTDVVSANGNKAGGATGTILQITGPVVDVQFPADMLPEIYNALQVTRDDGSILTLETQSHLGNDAVRAIAMSTTDGLRRGAPVQDMGGPITVPVGPETLGRILNVVGEPIDEAGPVNATTRYPIHRPAPRFEDQATTVEVFETGIKVI